MMRGLQKRAHGGSPGPAGRRRGETGRLPRLFAAIASAALLVFWTGDGSGTAHALLKDLSSSDATQRVNAAKLLTKDWRGSMDKILREISTFRSQVDVVAGQKSHDEHLYFRALTDTLREMIKFGSKDAISEFRKLDNHEVIRTLVRAARGKDKGIRVNSTIILANVSDNSSVCVAIDELLSSDLDDNGLINLLQVVQTVASYMYKENWKATADALKVVKGRLEKDQSQDYARTVTILRNIDERLARNDRKETPLPSRHSSCSEYKYRNSSS